MSPWSYEPTIGEILREPMVRALMRADRVNARQFEARLRLMAGEPGTGSEAEASEEEPDVSLRRFPAFLSDIAIERRCRC